MRRVLVILALVAAASAQVSNVACTKEQDQQTLSVSGNTLTFPDSCGTQTGTFELIISGAPATFSATISGVMRGGTSTALASTTLTSNVILQTQGGPYDKYTFTATWTGGSSPSVTVNRTATVARRPSGAYISPNGWVDASIFVGAGPVRAPHTSRPRTTVR